MGVILMVRNNCCTNFNMPWLFWQFVSPIYKVILKQGYAQDLHTFSDGDTLVESIALYVQSHATVLKDACMYEHRFS